MGEKTYPTCFTRKDMHIKNIRTAGRELSEAKKALILLHGRGSNSRDILGLAGELEVEDFALFAPQATNNTWYPYSFLATPAQNEPWLRSALELLKDLVDELQEKGIASENIFFAGFSQGACLTAEFVSRNAQKYGGVAIFTGGLIGDNIKTKNYQGDFNCTPVFIGSGDADAHVPVERVKETQELMEKLNARVQVEIYKNRPHTIAPDEIDKVNEMIFKNK